ncbi:ABC-F family ATP-binding cassette domain-containing protein [Patescibacteria group bacterium]|nr:ABC-F family ATP-binding cassette domain-containing protein [Patescibacteria group bacterium]
MIQVQGLEKRFGTAPVLSGVDFVLGDSQHGVLVGQNGSGKSTILKILARLIEPDAGSFDFGPNARVGYLPQDTSAIGEASIIEYLRGETRLAFAEKEMTELADHLDEPSVRLRYEHAFGLFERMHGYEFDTHARMMLSGFGMERIPLEMPISELSSGQKSKIALIAILMREDDVLLLDEPTNNLDLSALAWLEAYLRKSRATILVVSHDRRFVDRIADKIIELDWMTHTVATTSGTYTDYLAAKSKQRIRQLQEFNAQQEEIGRLEDRALQMKKRSTEGAKWKGTDNDKFLRGFKRDRAGKSAKGAKTIEKRIQQMDVVEKPFERVPLEVDIGEDLGEGNRDIVLTDVRAGYSDEFVIGPISLYIPFGTRVGILGLNGSGKSTLLKTVSGYLKPLTGTVQIGSGVRMGDMLQEHDSLPRDMTPIQYLVDRSRIDTTQSFALLARYGVSAEQAREPIEVLSPGMRARILIGLFSALKKNVLLLDEPTNHLDLEAMDALEEAIIGYHGTMLVVSHDRFFIEKLKLDELYQLNNSHLEKIENLEAYIRHSENKAKQLMRVLKK